jgi:hypothetical protein
VPDAKTPKRIFTGSAAMLKPEQNTNEMNNNFNGFIALPFD